MKYKLLFETVLASTLVLAIATAPGAALTPDMTGASEVIRKKHDLPALSVVVVKDGQICNLLGVSKGFIVGHVFPQPILMQPNRIGILPNELIDVHPVDFLRAPDPLLLPVHENRHELLPPLFAGTPLCSSQFPFTLSHSKCAETPNSPDQRLRAADLRHEIGYFARSSLRSDG
jgi:hypothetical protein